MTNPYDCMNPIPPSYSGVTINIANPGVNMIPAGNYICPPYPQNINVMPQGSVPVVPQPQTYITAGTYDNSPAVSPMQSHGTVNNQQGNSAYINKGSYLEPANGDYNSSPQNISTNIYQTSPTGTQGIPSAYPQQYYLSDYESVQSGIAQNQQIMRQREEVKGNPYNNSPTQNYEEKPNTETSQEIISELEQLQAEKKAAEENRKKTNIVALTNEYIMSLENYLDNPNSEIRLMAAKEVLTRLDEDRSRYDDAALNALLNKMLQDPNKIIRIAALGALSSELASGNEFTFQILNKIQQNPDADPQDVIEASQILLQRAAATEVKYTSEDTNKE